MILIFNFALGGGGELFQFLTNKYTDQRFYRKSTTPMVLVKNMLSLPTTWIFKGISNTLKQCLNNF